MANVSHCNFCNVSEFAAWAQVCFCFKIIRIQLVVSASVGCLGCGEGNAFAVVAQQLVPRMWPAFGRNVVAVKGLVYDALSQKSVGGVGVHGATPNVFAESCAWGFNIFSEGRKVQMLSDLFTRQGWVLFSDLLNYFWEPESCGQCNVN